MPKLLELRVNYRINQKELARLSGVSAPAISYIENYFSKPAEKRHVANFDTMKNIANALGLLELSEIDEFADMLKRKIE
jgi:transcriptional regulator with XRE-family HTH domain